MNDIGVAVLSNLLKDPVNIKLIEQMIRVNCIEGTTVDWVKYKLILYGICVQISQKKKLKDIFKELQSGLVMWSDPCLDAINDQLKEQVSFIENPFEVEEGVMACNKCMSKRVFSYSKQSRSADEPSTTYAECVVCGSKWQYNG